MARIRERHSVPRLRRLNKRVIKQSEPLLDPLPPLELSFDRTPLTTQEQLNPEVREFRPTREAAVAARVRMQDIADKEQAN